MADPGWPNLQDYAFSLQDPEMCFRDKELRKSTIKRDGRGQVVGASGNFAVVYKATLPSGGHRAVRAFTSNRPQMTDRYRSISEYLETLNMEPIVRFAYDKKGIKAVNKQGQLKSYPLVTMEWVEGDELYKWVKVRCVNGEKKKLQAAADRWFNLNQELTSAKIAHGDLQHANVMVTRNDALKLVDYDCMCVPKLVDEIALEAGVLPYQHPARGADTKLSPDLDNFSAIFIFVVLRALAAAPKLWVDFVEPDGYDKLLIRTEDFENPKASQLYRSLLHSPDPEVGRMSEQLFELYHSDIHSVPRLESLLFSYDRVRSALGKRDFDLAVQLVEKRGNGKDVPDDLKGPIQNARQRVHCRQVLEKHVSAGNELGMQQAYEPRLLNGYPRAQDAVAVAKDAKDVFQVLQLLEVSSRKQNWRELVETWDGHAALLDNRKSAKAWKSKVDGWRKRNQLCTAVLRMSKNSQPDVTRLKQSWQQLKNLRGHPEIDEKKADEIEKLIVRESTWESVKGVITTAETSEQNDLSLTSAWNESAFQGWPKAQKHRPCYERAKSRLVLIGQLRKQASRKTSVEVEESIVGLAEKIPSGYKHSLGSRITLARHRLARYARLMSEINTPPVSDLGLLKAFGELKEAQGEGLLDARIQSRVRLAEQRVPLIEMLRKIPAKLSQPEYDQKILSCWQDKLLRDSHDAKPWREKYGSASRRKTLLAELQSAINKDDLSEVARISDDPSFKCYPFPPNTQKTIERATKELKAARNMIEALKTGNRSQFRQQFDARSLKRHDTLFAPFGDQLIQWTQEEVLSPAALGLGAEPGARTINPDGSACHLRWSFPMPRYSDTCWITVTKAKPAPNSDPLSIEPVFKFPVTRKNYERATGGCYLTRDRKWKNYYVAVWAVVDLTGSDRYPSSPFDEKIPKRLVSSPFVLGKIW